MKRIAGLDQLRFVLALWVLLCHCQLVPDLSGQPQTSLINLGVRVFVDNLFNPVAAVIVFFVISGFCIHLPYRDESTVELRPYFTRRFVRILIPMAAAFLLAVPLKIEFGVFSDSILWSLVCEEIYYLLYPLLRVAAAKIGWQKLVSVAFVAALILAAIGFPTNNITHGIYPAFGPQLNWLLGLPCWLLGCVLAERLDVFKAIEVTRKQIWMWRSGVWLTTWVCSVLKFHSPIGYPLTLNFFAILAFFWLQREIAYYRLRRPVSLMEKAGGWSYSMYLIHLHAQAVYLVVGFPSLFVPLSWSIHLAFVLSLCYLFYLLVERPSHRLARRLSRRLARFDNRSEMKVLSSIQPDETARLDRELTLEPVQPNQ